MKHVATFEELNQGRGRLKHPIGFVPTMGFLHEGHMSLVELARKECKSVVASIFVNPSQFGPNEDLESYPRDLPRDQAMLKEAGVDLLWMPTANQMYPEDFQTWIDVGEISQGLEGAERPGHFRGVSTVVAKLFNAVRPDKAYFGQKDAQQVAVIRQMVRDLNIPVDIVVAPTVREADGLAMSSRNTYLTAEQREAAPVLFQALQVAEASYQSGERSADKIRALMQEKIDSVPSANAHYLSCANPNSLKELDEIDQDGALLSLAVQIGKTRLIDNLLLQGS
jgi:pantoate--beta-alanine ligase